VDSGLAKNFSFTGRFKVGFEFAGTNMLNHPNWGNPGLTISTLASVRVISGTTSGAGGLAPSDARAFRLSQRTEW
jgi:hypothetical protein